MYTFLYIIGLIFDSLEEVVLYSGVNLKLDAIICFCVCTRWESWKLCVKKYKRNTKCSIQTFAANLSAASINLFLLWNVIHSEVPQRIIYSFQIYMKNLGIWVVSSILERNFCIRFTSFAESFKQITNKTTLTSLLLFHKYICMIVPRTSRPPEKVPTVSGINQFWIKVIKKITTDA